MPPILIVYATREGQTRRVAERIAATITSLGHPVEVVDARSPAARAVDVARYGAAILAGSVHVGRHEGELVTFARDHRAQLDALPNAFVTVSMAQADVSRDDAAGGSDATRQAAAAAVQTAIDQFVTATGWQPRTVKPVAGALLYTRYGFLTRWIMVRITATKNGNTDTSQDHTFTDWDDLDRFAAAFVAGLPQAAA